MAQRLPELKDWKVFQQLCKALWSAKDRRCALRSFHSAANRSRHRISKSCQLAGAGNWIGRGGIFVLRGNCAGADASVPPARHRTHHPPSRAASVAMILGDDLTSPQSLA
ncbi:MAG: hypothetical protein MUC36_17905 [Planctomycetes bacterium]|jgi:hypothetical protein|nr:hypothetical protein [Planctomycetota bacterium]